MARRWQTNSRDRKSRKYRELHTALKAELAAANPSDTLSKAERKRRKSAEYMAGRG